MPTSVSSAGEQPKSGIVASITGSSPPLVTSVEDERFQFEDGDYVQFSEVKGIPCLNDGKPRKVKNCKGTSFELEEDLTGKGEHENGGRVEQMKMPQKFSFKPLSEALKSPGEFLMSDLGKFETPPQLHIAFQGLDAFITREKRLPKPGNEADANAVLQDAKGINASASSDAAVESLDEKVVKALAKGAKGDVTPMACLIGGIIGQEVIKVQFLALFSPVHTRDV
jgi:ubiquitin-activating enzyme E1